MVVNRSLLFELELNEYWDITTSKAQIISAFVRSCLLVHTFINICFEDDASLESPVSLLYKIEALDEGSVQLKNEIGVSFGNLSLCLVPYSLSYNLTSPISGVLIGQHLIFYSLTSPTCCNSPRKCTPVKYKKR